MNVVKTDQSIFGSEQRSNTSPSASGTVRSGHRGVYTEEACLMVEVTATSGLEWVWSLMQSIYLSITKMPPPSSPRVFPIGALALSNVMKAVPAVAE
jgi:hypothetical protein